MARDGTFGGQLWPNGQSRKGGRWPLLGVGGRLGGIFFDRLVCLRKDRGRTLPAVAQRHSDSPAQPTALRNQGVDG